MKNIHVLPTEKLSRLQKFIDYHKGRVEFELCRKDEFFNKGQHIYITSDEEINPNTYCLINGVLCKTELLEDRIVSRQLVGGATMDICKSEYLEIILTTDQDLIKDGVQAIDDYFLEWFVKNPSCEEVEVERSYSMSQSTYSVIEYKIIIPKEEPKQETLKVVGAYQQELFSYLHDLGIIALQSEMQEIERIVLSMQQQDKNKFSEEEVYVILEKFKNLPLIQFQEWFEQFKNK